MSDTVRGEFSFGCSNHDCNEGWSGDDLASIAQSVARHWNKEHGDDLGHTYEAIDQVQIGGHHITGNSYEVRKYTVYITSFDVIQRIGQEDGYAVPNDPDRVCDKCLREISDFADRIEDDPDDRFNEEWTCSACLREREIERRAQENQDLGRYVTDGGHPQSDTERPDPDDDPFACSGCGCYIGERKRIRGEGYCDACLADMGFAVEGYE